MQNKMRPDINSFKFLRKVFIKAEERIKQLPLLLQATPGEIISVSTILSIRRFIHGELDTLPVMKQRAWDTSSTAMQAGRNKEKPTKIVHKY